MNVEQYIAQHKRLLAVLVDPEKPASDTSLQMRAEASDLLFVGGSTATRQMTEETVRRLKDLTDKPVVLFPGTPLQFTPQADALLFLSLLTSRNAEHLIGQQIAVAREVRDSGIETIPMGYILLDGGRPSSVQRVTGSTPLPQTDIEAIVDTAIAGCLTGKRLIYLEAGSGAAVPVCQEVIQAVKETINVPLIVGGGICNLKQMEQAYQAGADIVVIGNHLEQHPEQASLFSTVQ
ncbi:MAG: geranylgeranylglyceryl/heptaprenylglyceryl phosphate synthase [Paludibacteraceae bacterium]|nr:geranylgeranylglyceryl/heptaprenylglyceryl phosphate synthase [Paludibacteraceae bacterium]